MIMMMVFFEDFRAPDNDDDGGDGDDDCDRDGDGDGDGDDDGDAYSDGHHGWSGHPGGGVGGVTALSRCQLCL